ncbi:unnamed protein product [Phytophthora fragariaefolia]|uniref:Unnamed protein product n=1 Tax=Phytophthora fragariaefolia TaxID=1490495 RepID=A0A9W6XTI0_9STRA|nr:unnamed protein product [Phytophthora fragariaefolia]
MSPSTGHLVSACAAVGGHCHRVPVLKLSTGLARYGVKRSTDYCFCEGELYYTKLTQVTPAVVGNTIHVNVEAKHSLRGLNSTEGGSNEGRGMSNLATKFKAWSQIFKTWVTESKLVEMAMQQAQTLAEKKRIWKISRLIKKGSSDTVLYQNKVTPDEFFLAKGLNPKVKFIGESPNAWSKKTGLKEMFSYSKIYITVEASNIRLSERKYERFIEAGILEGFVFFAASQTRAEHACAVIILSRTSGFNRTQRETDNACMYFRPWHNLYAFAPEAPKSGQKEKQVTPSVSQSTISRQRYQDIETGAVNLDSVLATAQANSVDPATDHLIAPRSPTSTSPHKQQPPPTMQNTSVGSVPESIISQSVEDAVETKLVPKDVAPTCYFEGALINAMGTFFSNTRITGCLYHFKQLCRRKSKKYGLPNVEARLAMAAAVFDVLTVINPEKIALEGVAWVKRNLNTKFPVLHTSLERFTNTIENLSWGNAAQRGVVIAGLSQPPTRKRFVLPNENDIENYESSSESSSDSDDDDDAVDSDA